MDTAQCQLPVFITMVVILSSGLTLTDAATRYPNIYPICYVSSGSENIGSWLIIPDGIMYVNPSKIINGNYSCDASLSLGLNSSRIHMRARFISYYMNDSYVDLCNDTDNSVLSIEIISPNGTSLKPYCQKDKPNMTLDLNHEATIRISSSRKFGDGDYIEAPRFQLLITPVLDKRGHNKTIPDKFFDCNFDDICVLRGTVCNGLNDCGNWADEKNCPTPGPSHHDDSFTFTIAEQVAIVFGFFAILTVLIVISVLIVRRYRRRRSYEGINS